MHARVVRMVSPLALMLDNTSSVGYKRQTATDDGD